MPFPEKTARRVERASPEAANRRISEQTERNIVWYIQHPEQIGARLDELDREWDTERVLETNAGGLALLGTVLAILEDRRFLVVPLVVSGFLLQHALQGWCPPLPLIRRLGVRSPREIERERIALKALRGDFERVKVVDAAGRSKAALQSA